MQRIVLTVGVIIWFFFLLDTWHTWQCVPTNSISGNCTFDFFVLAPVILMIVIGIPTGAIYLIWKSKKKTELKPASHTLLSKSLNIAIVFILVLFIALIFFSVKSSPDDTSKTIRSTALCTRKSPYTLTPEFARALSLLIQRLNENGAGKSYSSVFSQMYNCLDIKYANSDEQLNGAEGVFYFVPNGNKEDLTILVSPKYKANDDILTALLLSHELTHAFAYVADVYKNFDPTTACYQNEADAFMTEFTFLFSLNHGERDSLISRYETGNDPLVTSFFSAINQFMVKGSDGKYKIDTLPYVKSSSFYQKQCEKI